MGFIRPPQVAGDKRPIHQIHRRVPTMRKGGELITKCRNDVCNRHGTNTDKNGNMWCDDCVMLIAFGVIEFH